MTAARCPGVAAAKGKIAELVAPGHRGVVRRWWRRWWLRYGRSPLGAEACPYCGAGPERDCTRRCPLRRCRQCAGLGQVEDLNERLAMVDGRIVYLMTWCPTCNGSGKGQGWD